LEKDSSDKWFQRVSYNLRGLTGEMEMNPMPIPQ
jgi:hypothetical protein